MADFDTFAGQSVVYSYEDIAPAIRAPCVSVGRELTTAIVHSRDVGVFFMVFVKKKQE